MTWLHPVPAFLHKLHLIRSPSVLVDGFIACAMRQQRNPVNWMLKDNPDSKQRQISMVFMVEKKTDRLLYLIWIPEKSDCWLVLPLLSSNGWVSMSFCCCSQILTEVSSVYPLYSCNCPLLSLLLLSLQPHLPKSKCPVLAQVTMSLLLSWQNSCYISWEALSWL